MPRVAKSKKVSNADEKLSDTAAGELLRVTSHMRSEDKFIVARAYAREWSARVIVLHGIDETGKCTCMKKSCGSPGKHPVSEFFPKGVHSATNDMAIVRAALQKYPRANIGIALDGMTVVDVDGPSGKSAVRNANLEKTAKSISGRGFRLHYVGQLAEGTKKGQQLDLLSGPDRYVVMPPSRHANGKDYRWNEAATSKLMPVPEGVRDLIPTAASKPKNAKTRERGEDLVVEEGARNSKLTRYAGMLRSGGFSEDQLLEVLPFINRLVCDPPLANGELETIARSVGRYVPPLEEAFVTLSEVEEEDIDWLIKPFLVKGSLTVLDGDPGQGKSFFCAALAAAISVGKRLPFAEEGVQGDVVFLAAEDRNASIQVPRLKVNGGDLSKIHAQEIPFTLDLRGLDLLRAELERHRPVLVIIDPITAYMGSDVDFHRVNDTTVFLASVEALAREFKCAVLIVRHLNKSSGNVAIYRGIGSIAVTARVRSGWILGRDPDNPEMRAVAHAKSNYAKTGPTIMFRLNDVPGQSQAKVMWEGTRTDLDADSLVMRPAADRGRPDSERDDSKKFLMSVLENGPVRKDKLHDWASKRNISAMTLRRAAEDLGVTKGKDGKRSVWALPNSADTETDEAT